MEHGSMVALNVDGKATQLDIDALFQVDTSTVVEGVMEANVAYKCSTSDGAAGRGLLGLFGLLMLADKDMLEKTVVYFYIVKGLDDSLKTFFCHDDLRY
jgi:hypothetical protein